MKIYIVIGGLFYEGGTCVLGVFDDEAKALKLKHLYEVNKRYFDFIDVEDWGIGEILDKEYEELI